MRLLAVAKGLPITDPFFIQECPLCGTAQRMMIRGNFIDEKGVWHRYPDMGYSFCNCRDIFFTRFSNVIVPDGFNGVKDPIKELKKIHDEMKVGEKIKFSLWDVYFVNWNAPHEMFHWQCRKIHFLIDMDSFVNILKQEGFKVIRFWRDMEVDTLTPQHFHVEVEG